MWRCDDAASCERGKDFCAASLFPSSVLPTHLLMAPLKWPPYSLLAVLLSRFLTILCSFPILALSFPACGPQEKQLDGMPVTSRSCALDKSPGTERQLCNGSTKATTASRSSTSLSRTNRTLWRRCLALGYGEHNIFAVLAGSV